MTRRTIAIALCLLVLAPVAGRDAERRLEAVRAEIVSLRAELRRLESRERGILDELERLRAELRLKRAEVEAAQLEFDEVQSASESARDNVASLEQEQARRQGYLAARLRQLYRAGPDVALQRLLSGNDISSYLVGLRYAAFLNTRDARVVEEFRSEARRLDRERETLAEREAQLAESVGQLERARGALSASERRRRAALTRVRSDGEARRSAIAELERAAAALDERIRQGSDADPGDASEVDVRKLRGMLARPADGRVSAGFGSSIHPEFKTRIPHPGWDVEAPFGADIRAIFDGTVAYAEWMRGYGLTAIVDHGHGVLSIYAHASVLLVEPGERVARGQSIGKVGESGSLRGPYLYFELRVDGRAVDPARWLAPP